MIILYGKSVKGGRGRQKIHLCQKRRMENVKGIRVQSSTFEEVRTLLLHWLAGARIRSLSCPITRLRKEKVENFKKEGSDGIKEGGQVERSR